MTFLFQSLPFRGMTQPQAACRGRFFSWDITHACKRRHSKKCNQYLASLLESSDHCRKKLTLGFLGDSDRMPTAEDLKEMKYFECVVKEALRLYPPVPIIARQATEDFTTGKTYTTSLTRNLARSNGAFRRALRTKRL